MINEIRDNIKKLKKELSTNGLSIAMLHGNSADQLDSNAVQFGMLYAIDQIEHMINLVELNHF